MKCCTWTRWGQRFAGQYMASTILLMLCCGIANAQSFTQLQSTMTSIVTLLQGAGVAVVTVAIAWAGYKMIFQHARWSDVATVVLGALLIGAAATIAQWLIPALS
ncbi:MAG: TrbC/VirB2 family protein [Terracidiphilus sp.]